MSHLPRQFLSPLTAFLIGLIIGGCATPVPVDAPPRQPETVFRQAVDIPFITNRQLEPGEKDGAQYYGGERGALSAGFCTVGLRDGDSELIGVRRAAPRAVFSAVEPREGQEVVLYVHGYNEDFDRSCRHAAIMQDRLGLAGRLIIFTWPADRKFVTYATDVGDLAWSMADLQEVVEELAAFHGETNISLMGHSLGARALLGTLARMTRSGWDGGRFAKFVMLAPDVERRRFLEDLPAVGQRVDAITIYSSNNDRALWFSTVVNASTRLGVAYEPGAMPDNVELIDISPTGAYSFTGHIYHLRNPAVREDLRRLLGSVKEGAEARYERVPGESPRVWRLAPIASQAAASEDGG